MSNKYGIPTEGLKKIKERDRDCVYCHKEISSPSEDVWRGDWATIEHLNHLPPWNNPNTIAICCGSCNSSRSVKKISDWFKSKYCLEKNINIETVSRPVQEYVRLVENFIDRLSWTFAKTMPETPHYYIVKDYLPIEDQETFTNFGKYINEKGHQESFESIIYNYLNIGNYKYWMIDNILNRAEINTD